jgi:hypothetical protein
MTLAPEEAWPAQGHFGFEEEQPCRHKKWGCKKQRVIFFRPLKIFYFQNVPTFSLILA